METNHRSVNSTSAPMETNINNPQDDEKDSSSASPPILPQTAVRQSSDVSTMHMSFTESGEDLELETSTSSSTEEGSSSPNVSGYIPNIVVQQQMMDENNEAEEEEELVATLSSVYDVGRERFATALVVTSDIQNESLRLFSQCALASAR